MRQKIGWKKPLGVNLVNNEEYEHACQPPKGKMQSQLTTFNSQDDGESNVVS